MGNYIIVAMDAKQGIGKNGTLPWHLPSDLKQFKRQTTTVPNTAIGSINAIIMGRKTWDSLPIKPLPNRCNIVISRHPLVVPDGVMVVNSPLTALTLSQTQTNQPIAHRFIIGGGQIYEAVMHNPMIDELIITQIANTYPCDTFFPEYKTRYRQVHSSDPHCDNGIPYVLDRWARQ